MKATPGTTEIYKHGINAQIPYPLFLRYVGEWKYVLLDRWEYRADGGNVIGEDAGYSYDLGSVPWGFRWFISRVSFGFAFTAHDIGCDRLAWDDGTAMTQKEVDDLFMEVVEHVHHGKWMRFKARVAWLLIRAHSKTAKRWRRKKKTNETD